MPLPFIEAWKAWLARVAGAFVARGAPAPPPVQRVPPARGKAKAGLTPGGAPAPHRSGRRHG